MSDLHIPRDTVFAIKQRLADQRAAAANARPSGYYWVLLDYSLFPSNFRDQPSWEPASWDHQFRTWLVLGGRQIIPFYEPFIKEVDERPIVRPQ